MVGSATPLWGRVEELSRLDAELGRVRGGESAAVVIRGEAGIGKTTLLDQLAHRATGCRVTRIAGVESEIELPYAAAQQLLAPLLDLTERLPEPQQRALGVAFGQETGP